MDRAGYLAAAVLICLLSLGMGSMSEETAIEVPDVQEHYTVRLVDQADVSVTLKKFSFEGLTFLLGKLGKAQISIDFNRIDSISFRLQGENVMASVILKNSKSVEISIDRRRFFYGIASFADVKIGVPDVKTIQFIPKG